MAAPCVAETDVPPDDPFYVYFNAGWPPASVERLLVDIDVDEAGELLLDESREDHLREIISAFAPVA